jgi:F0F1-type ATP synthase membrane subunit b/b'
MHIPPDWGIFFALIVSFLVFWFIFDRLFFGPFLKLLGDRERKLKDLSERTEQLLKEEKAAGQEREHIALERVRTEIENELRKGERELEQLSRVLAVELAARVLGRPVNGAGQGNQNN